MNRIGKNCIQPNKVTHTRLLIQNKTVEIIPLQSGVHTPWATLYLQKILIKPKSLKVSQTICTCKNSQQTNDRLCLSLISLCFHSSQIINYLQDTTPIWTWSPDKLSTNAAVAPSVVITEVSLVSLSLKSTCPLYVRPSWTPTRGLPCNTNINYKFIR